LEAARAAPSLDGAALERRQGEEWQSDTNAQSFFSAWTPRRRLGDALKTMCLR